jgi:hypothetical protein
MTAQIIIALLAAVISSAPASAQPANPYSDRLQKLDDLQRRSVLRRAILDAGEPCKRVDAAGISGRYKNLVMWSARCTPKGDYGVYIGPDASVQVRPCEDARKLGLPPCRLPAIARP